MSVLVLSGCAAASTPESSSEGHGAIEGAAEVAEPQLHLVSIDVSGKASMLDLLNGTKTGLDAVGPAQAVRTDGRYVFAADDSGVTVVDSGVWTWDHVDHFHYYRSESKTLGRVTGEGVATISTGMLSTAGTTGSSSQPQAKLCCSTTRRFRRKGHRIPALADIASRS